MSLARTSVSPQVAATIFPIVGVIFTGYLVVGVAMPVLPLHVHQGLGFGTFVVGVVAGSQFGACLISRFTAGHLADVRGAKHAVLIGLLAGGAAGMLYLLSLAFVGTPTISLMTLLLGRAVLGSAESFMVAGALNWGLALAGAKHTGKVMSWMGTARYAAHAAGAPAGSALYALYGFASVAIATTLIPLLILVLVARLDPVPASPHARPAVRKVLGSVWIPGVGLALSCVGYGAITTFVVLLFAQRGWGQAWIALTAVSIAFIVGRLLFGHLPDGIGGPRVALASVLVQATGQGLIWLASTPLLVFAGAALAGLGYSLVYPGYGVKAIGRAPPENRGLAVGAYTACLDLALGIASPVLGLIACATDLSAVFLVSAIVVLCAAGIAICLLTPLKAAVQEG